MPELRFDPLRSQWVAFATERNDRTFLPTDFCPLCPTAVAAHLRFRFMDSRSSSSRTAFPRLVLTCVVAVRSAHPKVADREVIVYTPEHKLTLAQLPLIA